MKSKIIVLCFNYEPSQFLKSPDPENRFFTYGFGSNFGKLFGKYFQNYDTEVWRNDAYCDDKYYEKNLDNVKFKVFKSKKIGILRFYSKKFFKELSLERNNKNTIFFIVHTHNWHTYQILFRLKDNKVITSHHGDWSPFFLFKKTRGLRKLKAFFSILAEKLTFKNIKFFLICDKNQLNYIQKAIKNFKYEIFSTGLDVNKFHPVEKSIARISLGLDLNKKYILYVGKLYKYKQVDRLIHIWQEMKKNRPEIELLIVGNESPDNWGEEYYDLAVNSGAKVIGRVLNTELYKYYSAADVYVLMSLRDDYFGGTGIAPLEALACNTPVVSNSLKNYLGNNVNEIGEIPETEQQYKDAIIKVIDNPNLYKNMRESVIKFYSIEAVISRINNVFEKLN